MTEQGLTTHVVWSVKRAAATLSGWDAIQETLDAGRGHLWFHGEDISTSHPGAIYLNLVNEVDLPGVAFETVPVTFIFEFGEYLRMPRLDFLGITYIHSLSGMEYSPAELPEMSGIVQAGALEQDALREWFVAGFNRLADHLLRWQNFMTKSGELR